MNESDIILLFFSKLFIFKDQTTFLMVTTKPLEKMNTEIPPSLIHCLLYGLVSTKHYTGIQTPVVTKQQFYKNHFHFFSETAARVSVLPSHLQAERIHNALLYH